MTTDKNQAVIDFLLQCPAIANSPLFFNFLNAQDETKQIITQANDKTLNKNFIDGSKLKRYQFNIIDFRSASYQPIPKADGYIAENVVDLLDVQGIMDWIEEQNNTQNYPDFGSNCRIEEMRTTSENPNLNGVDTQLSPALAKYSISIIIDYIDTSKVLWK